MNKPKGKIIITGAGGFIGSFLTDKFSENSYQVIAFARNKINIPNSNVGFKKYNLNDTIDYESFEGATAIIHCAYIKDKDDKNAQSKNIEGTAKLIEYARRKGLLFVFLTSMSAHEKSESNYGKTKFIIENMLDENKDLIIRPGLVIGAGGLYQSMKNLIKKTRIIPLIGNGNQQIQYVGIHDLANFIFDAVNKHIIGTFNICANQSISIKNFYKLIAQQENKKIVFLPMPYFLINFFLSISGFIGIRFGFDKENLKGVKNTKYYEPYTNENIYTPLYFEKLLKKM